MRKLSALALIITAACSGSPTSADPADASPRFDGVFGGSGSYVGTPGIPTRTTSATGTEVTAADTTARGGLFGGSGN